MSQLEESSLEEDPGPPLRQPLPYYIIDIILYGCVLLLFLLQTSMICSEH